MICAISIGKKIALGANRAAANEQWARLEGGGSADQFPHIVSRYHQTTFEGHSLQTKRHYASALDKLMGAFKDFTLEQIEPKHVKEYMRRRTKKGAAIFEKRVLSTLFNWARGEGLTKAANPCRDIKFSKAEKRGFEPLGRRQRYVTNAEFDEVHARGDDILKDAMDLALLTGQRPSDLLKARRQDIIDGVLWVDQQKTGTRVGIRVEGALAVILERIQKRERAVQSLYLIADRRGQRVTYDALHVRFRKAVGDGGWQFRDIRAKAASDSPDLKRAQQLLGHANEQTTASVYRRMKGNVVAPLERAKPA